MSSIRESMTDPEFGKYCEQLFGLNNMTTSHTNISKHQSILKDSVTKEKDIDISALINRMDPENFKILSEENLHLSLSDNFIEGLKSNIDDQNGHVLIHQSHNSLF